MNVTAWSNLKFAYFNCDCISNGISLFFMQIQVPKQIWQWEDKHNYFGIGSLRTQCQVQQNVRYIEDTQWIFIMGKYCSRSIEENQTRILNHCSTWMSVHQSHQYGIVIWHSLFKSLQSQNIFCNHYCDQRTACNRTRPSRSSPSNKQNHDTARLIKMIMKQPPKSNSQ